MSINHFSTDQPQTFWFSPPQEENQPVMDDSSSSKNPHNTNPNWPAQLYHQQNPHPAAWFNLNQEDEEEAATKNSEEVVVVVVEKEPMFEKPLTPSDVGKLNRLVIPKQHAEKYFPLGGGESMEKGLLLSFEDESGKFWRFRYSYWNSSQSYVLTKGWSRYVKEKKLDAGDVVFFERHRTDTDRLFIGWRRRGGGGGDDVHGTSHGWSNRGSYLGQFYPPTHHHHHGLHAVPYQPHCLHGAPAGSGSVVQNQTPPSNSKKQVRLFGVNLDCEHEEPTEPFTPDGSSLSSSQDVQAHHDYSPNLPNYTDIIFSGDVNQMMNRRG